MFDMFYVVDMFVLVFSLLHKQYNENITYNLVMYQCEVVYLVKLSSDAWTYLRYFI